ncbi:hypothetical protein F442_22238 [Phytophthora nicotianae P10297]|uniref:Uncharacterized protein n=1 Tax=Phytophthora nicotianae P10297 TaxID=1317064 RepID=W2Y2P6_PHYNI|nr:hypothetical protein F442_22238 [Phytophthora nicotianae P10297]
MLVAHNTMLIQKTGSSVDTTAGSSGSTLREIHAVEPNNPMSVPCGRPPSSFENAASTTVVEIGQPTLQTKNSASDNCVNVRFSGTMASRMLPARTIPKPRCTQFSSRMLWRKYSIEKYDSRPSKPR